LSEKNDAEQTVVSESNQTKTRSFLTEKNLILSLAIILIVGIGFGFYGFNELNPTGKIILSDSKKTIDSSNGIPVELFVMSQCPYGTIAEDTLMPVIEAFGEKVNFKLQFIASEDSTQETGFNSLHGTPEVNEDIRQACIMKNVSQEKFFDYLSCANQDIGNIETKWKTCADQAKINTQTIESCFAGEGKNLLTENIKKSNELMIANSPSYYINNTPYSGGRTAQQLTRYLCTLTTAEVCSTLPPETEVNFFIINDSSCKECDASWISPQLKSWFPKLNVTEISFDSEEGKKVLDQFQAETLPFLYFDSTITQHYNWANFQLYTAEKEGLYQLNYTGTKFFKRTEKPNHLDLFVMSQCPYGIKAEANLKAVAEAMPDLTYSIYFIAGETETGFSSLHGQVEVNEDIRQSCIQNSYKGKLLDYQECVNKDITNVEGNWKACAISNEIPVDKIESCSTTDTGINLFKENIKVADEFGVGGSPNFLFNGQILLKPSQTFTYTPKEIQSIVCFYNAGLEGCDTELAGSIPTTTTTTTGGSC